MFVTKLSILRGHMASGNHRAALKLAASWGDLGVEKAAITRGWAAMSNPDFYRQLGQDPDSLIEIALQAIRQKYGIGEHNHAQS